MNKVKLLLYCTKAKPYLVHVKEYSSLSFSEEIDCGYELRESLREVVEELNGKIVAECDCEKVEEICCEMLDNGVGGYPIYYTETLDCIEELSGLDTNDLANYLSQKIGGEKVGYALHLSNVKVFDKPLTFERNYIYKNTHGNLLISKAPQNMCRIYDRFGNLHILLSIQPQWICKILNGEKTIEVRRQIVKELKEEIENGFR